MGIASAKTDNMKDLYGRLKAVGYDCRLVLECVLPDWWSDDLAAVPANRAIAELAIARHFGFRMTELCDPQIDLFSDFNGLPEDFDQRMDFDQHEGNWSNRLILGDSLLAMTSFEKEPLRGKDATKVMAIGCR